ncbi:MAG: sulfite exporter TauE/SafE family protein [Xanthobacteraceae bacterium]
MDIPTSLMLLAAGVAGGALSALVGGASLVLFPAMLAAGVPPIMAVASNTTAITPGNLLAAMADRGKLPKADRAFVALVVTSLIAATGGAIVLMRTPERLFELLVPLLLGFGTLLFAYARPIGAWLGRLSFRKDGATLHPNAVGLAMIVPVSIYGGYFGAGVGVLLIAALSVANGGDYRAANVTKNLVGSLNNLMAAAVFASQGAIAWGPMLLVATGGIAGGLAGAHVARILPVAAARWMVTGFGALLTGLYAWRYWF